MLNHFFLALRTFCWRCFDSDLNIVMTNTQSVHVHDSWIWTINNYPVMLSLSRRLRTVDDTKRCSNKSQYCHKNLSIVIFSKWICAIVAKNEKAGVYLYIYSNRDVSKLRPYPVQSHLYQKRVRWPQTYFASRLYSIDALWIEIFLRILSWTIFSLLKNVIFAL